MYMYLYLKQFNTENTFAINSKKKLFSNFFSGMIYNLFVFLKESVELLVFFRIFNK